MDIIQILPALPGYDAVYVNLNATNPDNAGAEMFTRPVVMWALMAGEGSLGSYQTVAPMVVTNDGTLDEALSDPAFLGISLPSQSPFIYLHKAKELIQQNVEFYNRTLEEAKNG